MDLSTMNGRIEWGHGFMQDLLDGGDHALSRNSLVPAITVRDHSDCHSVLASVMQALENACKKFSTLLVAYGLTGVQEAQDEVIDCAVLVESLTRMRFELEEIHMEFLATERRIENEEKETPTAETPEAPEPELIQHLKAMGFKVIRMG